MKSHILALVLTATAFAVPVRVDNPSAPYTGQQARSIKSPRPRMSPRSLREREWAWRRQPSLMASLAQSMS
jgi:hypothetical protein